ncbi:MAG: hypothetical protein JZU55_02565 [Afipia sp.]|nr:hypothetical protein [Afipia sp.]
MRTLLVLAVITGLLLWYALQGREWLKSKPWAQGFFAWVEPIEILLFKKSETILFARLKIVVGAVLTLLTQIGSIDLTPLMPFVPEKYQPYVNFAINLVPLAISLMGYFDEKLRYTSTKPIELVEVAEKNITPEVADAMVTADVAKVDAVAAVEASKAA